MKGPNPTGLSPPAGAAPKQTPTTSDSISPWDHHLSELPRGSQQWADAIEQESLERMFEQRRQRRARPTPDRAREYGKQREAFLKDAFPETYKAWAKSGYLKDHLEEVGQEAVDLMETLSAQMMTAPDLPTDYIDRVKLLEAIPLQVREIVQQQVIFSPPS